MHSVEVADEIFARNFLMTTGISSTDTATSLCRFSERTTSQIFSSRSTTFFSFTQVIERLLLTKSSMNALTKIPRGLKYECFLSLLK